MCPFNYASARFKEEKEKKAKQLVRGINLIKREGVCVCVCASSVLWSKHTLLNPGGFSMQYKTSSPWRLRASGKGQEWEMMKKM